MEVELGPAVTVGALALHPLMADSVDTPPYLTGPEASAAGLLLISEQTPPVVSCLLITNLADVPILLAEGETLLGGDQDRTMNVTVLCPPGRVTKVPVSCVEAGRWGSRRHMSSTGRHAPGSLRSRKSKHLSQSANVQGQVGRSSDQRVVWDSVTEQSLRHRTVSPTRALEDIYLHAEDRITPALNSLRATPGQVGVVCTVGNRVVGLDMFHRTETLDSYLRAIVAGHSLDIDVSHSGDPLASIEAFLAKVNSTNQEESESSGLGKELVFRGEIHGVGLRVDGVLIHVAAFPDAPFTVEA